MARAARFRVAVFALFALPVLAAPASAAYAASAAQNAGAAASSGGMVALAEALVDRLPMDKVDRAAGFFGPVVKKYQHVLWDFQDEYLAADTVAGKAAIIVKYQPKVDEALADAKAMKVPPRYEDEKAGYIRIAEVFAATLRFLVRLAPE